MSWAGRWLETPAGIDGVNADNPRRCEGGGSITEEYFKPKVESWAEVRFMSGKAVLTELSKTIGATLVVFAIVESLVRVAYFARNSMVDYVPLPYVIGHSYGPMPPWLDGLRILKPDETLIWKNRPMRQRKYIDVFSPTHREEDRAALLRQFLSGLPDSLKDNPVWEISLNSTGFRDREFPKTKQSSTFRIICLGDSWTFGANVGQQDAYPQRLQALLRQEFSEAEFEVFNLGVLGYSSYQGLELLKKNISELLPDLVVIAFAMNDSKIGGSRDKDMPAYLQKQNTLRKTLNRILERIESYKLLRYWAQVIRYTPGSIGDELSATDKSAQKPEEAVDYEKHEPWVRVSPIDYQRNIHAMINLARRHEAGVILVYNQLSADAGEVAGIARLGRTSVYRMVLEEISRAEGVPLVDSSVLITRARRRIEEGLESQLNLRVHPARRTRANGEIEVIFRVYSADWPVAKAVYITGTHPKLGGLVPNKIPMYDDGTHGDQNAGDKVWSYSATFPPGTSLFYVYTNSGEVGKWEGLDIPHIRSFKIEAKDQEDKIYRPIESFGTIHMQADGWHTNAAGYELIAKALLEKLKEDASVRSYLGQIAAN
jgi:lysophospholipase L1-like esterase